MRRVCTLLTALAAATLVWFLLGLLVLGLLGHARDGDSPIVWLLGSVLTGMAVWYAVSIARNVRHRRG